jgi:hypothetical protein
MKKGGFRLVPGPGHGHSGKCGFQHRKKGGYRDLKKGGFGHMMECGFRPLWKYAVRLALGPINMARGPGHGHLGNAVSEREERRLPNYEGRRLPTCAWTWHGHLLHAASDLRLDLDMGI